MGCSKMSPGVTHGRRIGAASTGSNGRHDARACPGPRKKAPRAEDAEQEGPDAEVAIHDPELARLDGHLIQQRPAPGCARSSSRMMPRTRPTDRLIDGQRLAGQGRGGGSNATRRSDGRSRARTLPSITWAEYPGMGSGRKSGRGGDQFASPISGLVDKSGGDRPAPCGRACGRKGRERGDLIELPSQEGPLLGEGARSASDISHDLDEIDSGRNSRLYCPWATSFKQWNRWRWVGSSSPGRAEFMDGGVPPPLAKRIENSLGAPWDPSFGRTQ